MLSSIVRGKALTVARWIGRGIFKAAALIGAFVLIIALWLWDASILTRAADQNLQLIKVMVRPGDDGSTGGGQERLETD
jgi:hypothetical protein